MSVPPSDRRWRVLAWLVTVIVAAPLCLPGWLPLTDLPEHAAAMSSIAHFGDPAFRIDEHYVIGWTTSQYLLVHLAGGALAKLIGDAELAARIVLVAIAIGWVESSRMLLRAFKVDERLVLMSALLFWNRAVVIGFLPYVASLPLLFATLAVFARSNRSTFVLAVLGIAVFYTHASAFTLLTATGAALAITRTLAEHPFREAGAPRRILGALVRRLAWLGPGATAAAIWVARGRFGLHGSTIHESSEIGTMEPLRALKLIALYAHDTWTSHVDDVVGICFWLLFLTLLLAGELRLRREPDSSSLATGSLVPLAVALVVYLLTPFRVGSGLLLNVRMAPVLGLFALLGLRSVSGRLANGALLGAALLSVVQCVDNVREMRRLQRDVEGLPELIAKMPRGSRLITLTFSGFDPEAAHFTPWLHVGSYHRVYEGGVASFSFSELNHWSVQYRPEAAPPKQAALSWGMRPCLFRNASDGAYFDYVLARGHMNPFAYDPPGPRWVVRGKTAKYTLYEKDLAALPAPPGPDDGPCATGASGK